MAVLNIIKLNNPKLRRKAKPVKKITPGILTLIQDMEDTMRAAPGIGLAANQIARPEFIFVADVGEGLIVAINPKILRKTGTQTIVEGCLSIPGLQGPVERASYVKLQAMDENGEILIHEATGLLAQCFQHEMDHLDGSLFIDRVKDPSTLEHVALESARHRI